ncbi:MAG TPA: PucR family transcriptional regulator [Clostridia bacterium]|nr:PucR family transcriptional regulator [Clostridia bacterium]
MDQISTTLQDLINMKKLEGMRLVAGQQGLDHEVTTCCILDYEYDPEFKNKFTYTNFRPGMLLLTSFTYAKDREYLISDAIKQLIATGISGLAIKNVYHLRIPDSTLRYADTRSFPIFMIDDPSRFVEPIIYSIHEGIRIRQELHTQKLMINTILRLPLGQQEEIARAYKLYPMMGRYYLAYYFRMDEEISPDAWTQADAIARAGKKCMIYSYRSGALLLCTVEIPDIGEAHKECEPLVAQLVSVFPPCMMGLSELHYSPVELRDAIEESMRASIIRREPGLMRYADMGSYQIMFCALSDKHMRDYSERILAPVFDYDVQNEGRLQKTLFGLVECKGNLRALSEKLGQHENTLRQRLARIEALTGLDFRNTADYEELSLAVKIRNCLKWQEEIED